MKSLYILLWTKQQKNCLEGEREEIGTWNCKIINSKCEPSHISNFKRIILSVSTRNPPRRVLSNFQAKKNKAMVSMHDRKIWRAGNTTNFISLFEICSNFRPIHHWWTTLYFRRRRNNSNCDLKSSFLGYFHFKI